MNKQLIILSLFLILFFQYCSDSTNTKKEIEEKLEEENNQIPYYYYRIRDFLDGNVFCKTKNCDTGYLFRAFTCSIEESKYIVIELVKYYDEEWFGAELVNSYQLYYDDFKKAVDTSFFRIDNLELIKWNNSKIWEMPKNLIVNINKTDTFEIDLANYEQNDIQIRKYNKGVDNIQ